MESRSMKELAVLAVSAIALFMIAGCSYVWVKPGGTQGEFSQDRYACMQQAQQRASSTTVNVYGGASSGTNMPELGGSNFASSMGSTIQAAGDVGLQQANRTNSQNLFNACMNARGWYLQRQSR
jgi:hypothetical protein